MVTQIVQSIFEKLQKEYFKGISAQRLSTGVVSLETSDAKYILSVHDTLSDKCVTFKCGLVSQIEFIKNDGCKYDFGIDWDDNDRMFLFLTKNGEKDAKLQLEWN